MKKLLVIALSAFILAACSSTPPSPTATQVAIIQNACLVDAGLRPIVGGLEIFATPVEVLAINAAHGVIDPICANPSANIVTNVTTILASNIDNIKTIITTLQARKAGK